MQLDNRVVFLMGKFKKTLLQAICWTFMYLVQKLVLQLSFVFSYHSFCKGLQVRTLTVSVW